MQVNLSRIHNMINALRDEISHLISDMRSSQYSYVFPIFEMTTDEDFGIFKKGVEKRKADFEDKFKEIVDRQDYVSNLKNVLHEANHKYGVSQKLLAVSRLNSKLERLAYIYMLAKDNCNDPLRQIKKVDFYKTTYTDTVKSHELRIWLFNQEDVENYKRQVDDLEGQIRDLNDEIATLNQTTLVEIKSFEEFRS